MAGSVIVHSVSQMPANSLLIVFLALLTALVMTTLNYLFVGTAILLEHGNTLSGAIRRMRIGTVEDFALSFLAWAVVGAMLAVLYSRIEFWALVAFLGPAVWSRQSLLRSQMFVDTTRAYRSRERALAEISARVFDERSDERRLIAADLHDEVLQPLFKVTLMAHVLKADIASGRLLELDQDLPELLTAAEVASSSFRDLIADLRKSSLGRGGLAPALRRLLKSHEERSPIQLRAQIEHVQLDSVRELALYQIAKEALSNAMTHSKATHVTVELGQPEAGVTKLDIRDDGDGFDPTTEREGHFGIQIMRERALSVGATFYLDASPGEGCHIVLLMKPNSDRGLAPRGDEPN